MADPIIPDIKQSVIGKIKIDPGNSQRKIEELHGKIRGLGAEGPKLGEAMRKGFDAAKAAAAQFQAGLGAVGGVLSKFQGALDVAKFAGEVKLLERSLPTGALARLSEATRGTVSDLELMRVAAKAMNGDFALTTEQMAKVMEAAQALSQRGYGSVTQVSEKLVDALAKGVNKLDDFGISLEKSGDRATDLSNAFAKFNEIIINTAPMDAQTESIRRQQTAIDNLNVSLKTRLGLIVGGALTGVEDFAGDVGLRWALMDVPAGEEWETAYAQHQAFNNAQGGDATYRATKAAEARRAAEAKRKEAEARAREAAAHPWTQLANTLKAGENARAARKQLAGKSGGGAAMPTGGISLADMLGGTANWIGSLGVAGSTRSAWTGADADANWLGNDPGAGALGGIGRIFGGVGGGLAGGLGGAGGGLAGGTGLLGADVTPQQQLAEHMKKLANETEAAGAAFGVFNSGFAAMIDAAITGNESIAKAFSRAAAAKAKAIAVEAGLDAAKYGYMAIAALAMGDVPGATAYGLAAAKAAALAVGAGAASAGLGALAGGGGGAGRPPVGARTPAGGGFLGGGGGGGAGPTTIIVQVNDHSLSGNVAETGAAISRAIDKARRSGHVRNDGAVTFGVG